jgi:hypothetical protein
MLMSSFFLSIPSLLVGATQGAKANPLNLVIAGVFDAVTVYNIVIC